MHNLIKLGIWAAVVAIAFALLWWRGYVRQFADYIQQTREELRKCTWPTWDELKGSTVLMFITIALLGVFIVAVDYVFYYVMMLVAKV